MIHGYFATIGTYGSWFPNDPRGSKSKYVGSRRLYEQGGKVPQHDGQPFEQLTDQERRRLAALSRSLKRPTVVLSEPQIAATGLAICAMVQTEQQVTWALAVLPTHVHLVFARCRSKSEDFMQQLKDCVDNQLAQQGLLPMGCDVEHSLWAKGQWIEYLDSDEAIESAIHYTQSNPAGQGLAFQIWPCVTSFAGIESNIVSYPD